MGYSLQVDNKNESHSLSSFRLLVLPGTGFRVLGVLGFSVLGFEGLKVLGARLS